MPSLPESPSRVRLLDPQVVNKIAAGEVVDRPAAVLKELIENALDAGADRIEAQIEGGGRKRIGVVDNGSGMPRDDALLAIERHATSKIRTAGDIENIHTLGFRGEALAAIAAVSRFRLRTASQEGHPGVEITVFGGILGDVREIGFPRGCAADVRDLFFNLPARRKFLRTPQTELAHVRQVFIVHALAHPDIGFTLTIDGRKLTALAGGETLEQRLHNLFGARLVRDLRPIVFSSPGVRLQGFAGIPPEARRDRDHQFFFVNGRPAGAPLISYAVRESYQSLLPRDRFPPVILFIETDPGLVDVNVHPQKREVRFRDPGAIRDAIQHAVAMALRSPAQTADNGAQAPPVFIRKERPLQDSTPEAPDPELSLKYPDPRRLSEPPLTDEEEPFTTVCKASGTWEEAGSRQMAAGAPPWRRVRVIDQIGGLFVLLETEDGLVIMDPHAAHERVLYDRYMRTLKAGKPPVQELLIPVAINLTPIDAAVLQPHLENLRTLGFGIHEFGSDGFMVDGLPQGFGDISPADWIDLLVTDMKRDGGGRRLPSGPREEAVARTACQAAVKARQRLSTTEIEQLVRDLAATEMPYTCPHGRPIMIHLSYHDLRQRLGR